VAEQQSPSVLLPSSHCSPARPLTNSSPQNRQPLIRVPWQALLAQTSFSVQRLALSHGLLLAVFEQPVVSEQKSSVQALLSLHIESLALCRHVPSAASHESIVHEIESLQFLGGCWHVPPLSAVLQTSSVQTSPSSHSAT